MRVEVHVFAALRDAFAGDRVEVEVPEPATGAALKDALAARFPRWRALIEASRLAVGVDFMDEATRLPEGEDVVLIPPVSGGAPISAAGLSHEPLDLPGMLEDAVRVEAGGIAAFAGTVRSPNEGRDVLWIEYSAYEAMALARMEALVAAVQADVPGSRVIIRHRLGRLVPGEASVVIVASAPHRDEAFRACRAAIERLKVDVPIWKHEAFADGERWVGAPEPDPR